MQRRAMLQAVATGVCSLPFIAGTRAAAESYRKPSAFCTKAKHLRQMLDAIIPTLPPDVPASELIYDKDAHLQAIRFLTDFVADFARCKTA